MNALKASVGTALLLFGFWIAPPAHDPVILALPNYVKFLALAGNLFFLLGGLFLLGWGVIKSIASEWPR